MQVIATPYALSNIKSTEINHIEVTFRIVSLSVDASSNAFKNEMALKITALYKEANDLLPVRRKRRALGSVTTYVSHINIHYAYCFYFRYI